MYNPEGTPPLIPNAMARIERRLPQPGNILVRVGERVEPESKIATAFVTMPPQVINMAQTLGIPPAQVERAMRLERGNRLAQGEVLARANRLGGRVCYMPVSGMITALDHETGYVTIVPDPIEYELYSAIRGIVMEVFPHEGVLIETPAAQVYGVFGLGKTQWAVLQLFVTDPSEVITDEHRIDSRNAYAILIGGAGITAGALRRAVKENVYGIIVGGIEERELRAFLEWSGVHYWHTGGQSWYMPDRHRVPDFGLTLVVTEGFGIHPMAQPIFDLLSAHDLQEALIEGVTCLRMPLRRPRIIIPSMHSAEVQMDAPRPPLQPGSTVRLLDAAHLGQIAQVQAVPTTPRRIRSGVRTAAVEVVQDNGIPFWVPRANLEVLT